MCICSYVSTFVALPVTNYKIFLFTFLFFTLSLWYPFCPAQAAGLCDRLWIRPVWLPSEVWESKWNLGTAVQKLCGNVALKVVECVMHMMGVAYPVAALWYCWIISL
jgi:hypothetical protein